MHHGRGCSGTKALLSTSLVLVLNAGCGKEWMLVQGSTCSSEADCDVHPSCARREGGCVCHKGACYFDPDAPLIDPTQSAVEGCRSCHGSRRNAAPPTSLSGAVDTFALGVGAHQQHLFGGQFSLPTPCSECHVVPEHTNDAGHIDGDNRAEVIFGPLATHAGEVAATFNAQDGTCVTYCHGATLRDGAITEPVWNVVDGTQAVCGSCHGLPPGGDHPRDNHCELCHLPTAGPAMTIANTTTHIDGILQTTGATCNSCHGDAESNAPPRSVGGNLDDPTTLTGVGAHRSHLSGGQNSKAVECQACHVVPNDVADPGHNDTPLPAEVVFGTLSQRDGHTPAWDRVRCSDTYCHAGIGAAAASPVWTTVDGSQAACDSCHGMPPDTPEHQQASDCSVCHLPTAGPNHTIARRDLHVDGVVQAATESCNTCHGDDTSSAPPPDLNGDTDPTDPEVGAHRAHLSGGKYSAPVSCDTCHLVPQAVDDPGHVDTPPPAEVIFSGRAAAVGTSLSWDSATRTCQNTYCHGAATTGGTHTDPAWNEAPGSLQCDACHGLPPAAPHPQLDTCENCHAPVAGPNKTIALPKRHVDGIVDVSVDLRCNSCHGNITNDAPPTDLAGNFSGPQVGAHQAHLLGTSDSRAVACSECHSVPAKPDDAGHYDTPPPAELVFGPLARNGGAPASWDGAQCTSYCHGASLPGGTNTVVAWDGAPLSCNACHGMPPNDADHAGVGPTQCDGCHTDTAGPGGTIRDPSLHVNGIVEMSASCDACHGQNGSPAPPKDLSGNISSNKVGAHSAHLSAADGADVPCNTCHRVPVKYSDPGHVDDADNTAEITFGGIAGTSPTYSFSLLTCTNTYCHGATLPGGKSVVTWNAPVGSESTCTSCHGMPPNDAAHQGVAADSCADCHDLVAGSGQTILPSGRALHIDGTVQVSGGACGSCHATPPDKGNEDYSGGGGAHAVHVNQANIECSVCHGNNGSGPQHNQGNDTVAAANVDIVFSSSVSFPAGTTMNNGSSASYDRGTKTCRVGCHNPRSGNPPESPNLNNAISWTASSPGCSGCHDAVATAPPRNHNIAATGSVACMECHDMTGHTQGTVKLNDPDPTDSFVPTVGNVDPLCKTCHDGGSDTHFGGKTAQDVSAYWRSSAHGAENMPCGDCHVYHSSNGSPQLFIDRAASSCMQSGCHQSLQADFNLVAGGPISHHRIEGGSGIAVTCINCHNPHLSQASPYAAVSPDDKWSLYYMPASARSSKRSSGDYRSFCLACHDATPPPGVKGALNISGALQGGSDPSYFRDGGESLHRNAHNGWNCQSCHEWHGSGGTQGINRGRMLLNYIKVNQFNNGYSGKSSCGTASTPGSFRCH